MLKGVQKVLDLPSMQLDLSAESRETAVKHFNIKDYLTRWEEVFEESLR